MAHKDIRGDAAKPIYDAFGFGNHSYNGVPLAEIRVQDSKIQIDVHGEDSFKSLEITENGIALNEIAVRQITVTRVSPDGKLSVTTQPFDFMKGPTGTPREITPATAPEIDALRQRLHTISSAVFDAAKEYIKTDKVQCLQEQVSIMSLNSQKPRTLN